MRRTEFSGSNAYRRIACGGSAAAERDLVVHDQEGTAEGTEIHRLLANPDEPRGHLNHDAMICLEECEAEAQLTIEQVFGKKPFHLFRERETSIKHENRELIINHIDLTAAGEKDVLVQDYKTGRIPAAAAEDNWQLGCYLASLPGDFENYYGKIIQPRIDHETSLVVYTRDEIAQVRATLIEAALNPDPERVPSEDSCRHCAAFKLGTCPEARAKMHALTVPSWEPMTTQEYWASLDPEARTRLLEGTRIAMDLGKTLRDAARELMAVDPEFIPGYRLGRSGSIDEISDTKTVLERLRVFGFSQAQLDTLVTIPKGRLMARLENATGKKGDELEKIFEDFTNGCLDSSDRAGRIIKAKPPKAPKKRRKLKG